MWLMRFNNDKFLITIAVKGSNGLELKTYEISFKDGEYFVDGASHPNLESLVNQYEANGACIGSPYMSASNRAHRDNYNYYDERDEIPFRDAWSELTSDSAYTDKATFNVQLYNWLSIYNPSPKLQLLAQQCLPRFVRDDRWSHVARVLRLCEKSFTLPLTEMLSFALSRDEDMEAAIEYLFSIGADPNQREENSYYVLHTYASYPKEVSCLLKYPKIEVNILDEDGNTPVIKSVDSDKALEYFLNDPRTNVNAGRQPLLDAVISTCQNIEMMQKVIERGFNLDKNDGKYYTQLLENRHDIEERVKGWKILVDAGVDINAVTEDNRTVLHAAVKKSADQEVLALLDLGASVEGNLKCLDSPLHLASSRGNVKITKLLMARGADVKRVNEQGKNAEDLAVFATKKLFRNVAPPLGDFTFTGHQIEFGEQKEAITARYFAELTVIGDHLYVQSGLYRQFYPASYDEDAYYSGSPFMDFWKVDLGNCLNNSKDTLGQWEKIELPARDVYHHSFEMGYTVHMGDEIWFPGFNDHWVKYNAVKNKFSKDHPVQYRKAYAEYLKNRKGYPVGNNVIYPSGSSLFTIDPNGKIKSTWIGGEDLQKGWSNNHAMIGDDIWLKNDLERPIPLYCLDKMKTWYKVGEVDSDITGVLVPVGKYLLSTAIDKSTNETKICVLDTEYLNWTKHSIQLSSGTLVTAEKQSMYVHNGRLILFGGQTSNATVTNAMYSIDLTPLIGVKSLAMISASAVVANQDKLTKEAIDNLPNDIKERMGFNNNNKN